MGMHEDRIKAMRFEHPDRIPISVGILPSAWMKYRTELDALVARHPVIFGAHKDGDRDYDAVPGTYVTGDHVDAWGCVWSNVKQGMESIVTGHPVPTREAIHSLRMPEKDAGLPHGFMFLRLTDLRGFAEAMMDFAEEPVELQMMLDVVRGYNVRQAERITASLGAPQFIYLGDDLGMQTSLPMSPDTWRKYLKPCFKAIYAPFLAAGHFIYMHTDGHIYEIIPDLIECGANVINPQWRANGVDNIAAVCKGKVCVDIDLDRQMFPFCTPADIDAHIEEAVRKLGAPEGGLWLKAEVADDISLDNMEAICSSLEKHSLRFS